MNLQSQRDGLLAACQLVSAAAAARTTTPILSNIKAIAENDRLTLMATDREIGIRYEVAGVEIDEPGEAILPVGKLTSILRESADERIRIEADDRKCRVTTSVSEYEMPGEDPAGFPDVPTMDDEPPHTIPAGVLRTLIRRTAFAAAKQDTKYAITGILWEVEDKKIRLVATDTRRLALAIGAAVTAGPFDPKGQSHLVPTKALALLDRTLGSDDEIIQVRLRANDVLFRTDRAVLCSRLLEGRYPPYRDILPKKSVAKIPLASGDFLKAVRQAAIMTDEESKRVTFTFAPRLLTLAAQGATTGKSKVTLAIDHDGPEIAIHFDPQYLIDMLKGMDEGEVLTLELNDGQKPALFRSGDDYQYLVMPLT